MKTFLYKTSQWLTLSLCLLIWIAPSKADAEPNTESSRQEQWGGQTNGLAAGVLVTRMDGQQQSPTVAVILREVGAHAEQRVLYFGGEAKSKSGTTNPAVIPAQYYMATNGFCGPIELRDSAGQPVQLRNPSLAAASAYPGYYSLQAMEGVLMGHHSLYSGPPLPTPLMSSLPQLARFNLEKEFVISSPGEYEFTVWPKVYKRVSSTNDTCQRIDVPPVSVKLKWP